MINLILKHLQLNENRRCLWHAQLAKAFNIVDHSVLLGKPRLCGVKGQLSCCRVQGLPNWAYTKGSSWGCGFTLVSYYLRFTAEKHFRPPAVHVVYKWPARRSCWRREDRSLRRRHQAISKCLVYRTLTVTLCKPPSQILICTTGRSAIILDLTRLNVKH